MKQQLRRCVNSCSTIKVACSNDAGTFLFGADTWRAEGILLKNGISVDKFAFSESRRVYARRSVGVKDDAVVYCHVGRFVEQKNQLFLLDVFREIVRENENAVLWFVGNGHLLSKAKEKALALHLEDKIVFFGERTDVETMLDGADAFLFPSLYEGFGIALIEAECSWLPCVCSDCIPEDACVPGCYVAKLPLSVSTREWAKAGINAALVGRDPGNAQRVRNAGFDQESTATEMLKLYRSR